MDLRAGDDRAPAPPPLPVVEAGETIHAADLTGRTATKSSRQLDFCHTADTFRPSASGLMASSSKGSAQSTELATELNAEQALGLVSYGLMQRLANEGQVELPWLGAPGREASESMRQLKQRLELTALAIETGAPLSTQEVSLLLGAKPGSDSVERGGLKARRISRNVWRLSRVDGGDSNDAGSFRDDRFRRRL